MVMFLVPPKKPLTFAEPQAPRVWVRRRHYRKGARRNVRACAVALAVSEATSASWVSVGGFHYDVRWTEKDGRERNSPLPLRLKLAIALFDRGLGRFLPPMSFRLKEQR